MVIGPKTVGRDITDWDTKVYLAKQYLNRLKEDARISARFKLKNGEYPAMAPFGYMNIRNEDGKRWIVLDPKESKVVIKIYEWYATGAYSMSGIQAKVKEVFGLHLPKSYIDFILKNPFYYHCTGYRGKCNPKWFREEELTALLAQAVEDIHVPDDVAQEIAQTLKESHQDKVHFHKSLLEDLQGEYQKLEKRIEKMYEDYLDGRITESFYNKKREEEYYLSVSYLLKVANKAPGLFKSSEAPVKRQVLKLLLQNCQVNDATLCVAYRSPFDLFAKATSRTKWLTCLDNFRTYCSSEEALHAAQRVPALMAA